MNANTIRDFVIEALLDLKGIDIKTLDVRELTSITDYMIVVTGSSSRHTRALALRVGEALDALKLSYRIEGEKESDWVLVDAGSVVVHVMQQSAREYYCLEKLWVKLSSSEEESQSPAAVI